MTALGWILLIIGALITYLAKPLLAKKAADGQANQTVLYWVKLVGMWVVIVGAVLIFIAGGKVDVGAIR